MCQNNQYAISVPIEKQLACKRVSDRAIGYGMPGVTVDGSNPLNVYEVVKEARNRAIKGEGPTLIEVLTYRFTHIQVMMMIGFTGTKKKQKCNELMTQLSYLVNIYEKSACLMMKLKTQ